MKFVSKIFGGFYAFAFSIFLSCFAATLAVAKPSEVWVDDNYCNVCFNDGHTWDYDAFNKIQNGIDAVASPGTVNVAEGYFKGKVVLKQQVSLLGAGMGVSTIDGMGLKEGVEDTVVAMATDSKISGFSIINGGWNGVECKNVSAIIERNLVAHHEAIGIHLIGYGSRNSIVSNNIVTDCASYMPKLQFVGAIFGNSVYGSPQIIHNTVVGNHYTGIGFCHPGIPIIKNNIVVGNLEGIGVCVNTDTNNSHNNSWNNAGYNWANLEPGEGAISKNPLFVNENGKDYHLQKESPCIDAGADVRVNIDMDGDSRPIGLGYDIGADEYIQNIPVKFNIYPKVLNLKSRSKSIISSIRLPKGYDPDNITRDSLELYIPSCSDCGVIFSNYELPLRSHIIAFFPRQDLIDKIETMDLDLPAKLDLKVSGKLNDETPFEGSDTIWVIKSKK